MGRTADAVRDQLDQLTREQVAAAERMLGQLHELAAELAPPGMEPAELLFIAGLTGLHEQGEPHAAILGRVCDHWSSVADGALHDAAERERLS